MSRPSARASLALLILTSCARHGCESGEQEAPRPGQAAQAADPTDLNALRESARETLTASCSECHTKTLPTAVSRALRVFDLTEPDWARRMSEGQLREASRRLGEPFAPTAGEGDVRPIDVSKRDRARFAAFVDAEVARRLEVGGQ